LLHKLIGHTAAVTSVSWVAGGERLATGSLDATARLWGPDGSDGVVISAASAIHAIAWSPDGNTLATGEEDHYVQFWKTTGASLVKSGGWGASVDALAWLSDTVLYLGTDGTGVHAYDLPNGKHYIKNTLARVNGMAISPDGHYLASALASGLVDISKLTGNGGFVAALPLIHGAAYSVAWSPDGSMLAVGYSDGHAIIYSASTRHQLYSLKHGGPVYSVSWSPNATSAAPLLVSGAGDNTVNVWNLAVKGNPTIYTGHTDAVLSVSWGVNLIASASKDQSAILWQPPSA
jgi:WD40 repeat protein